MDSRTTTSPPPTQVTQRNATTRRAMTMTHRRMRGRSPVRIAHGGERPRCAQTGREFSPRPDRCQRKALAVGCALILAATLAQAAVPSKAPGAAIKGDAVDAARALGARLAAVRGLTAR